MDSISKHTAIEFSPNELASILTECFEGYLVPFVLNGTDVANRFWPECLDGPSSQIWMSAGKPVAVCLIARQGWTCRVAAMAVAPKFRGQKIGTALMQSAIEESRNRKDKRFLLEVIEQNETAIQLYKKVGLKVFRRLVGYHGIPPKLAANLEEIDPSECVRQMVGEVSDDLPWDFKPETLVSKRSPAKAFQLGEKAFALVTEAPKDRVVLWSFFVKVQFRRQGIGRELIGGLANQFPNKTFVTPIALPDDLGSEFMAQLNFSTHEISQLEMRMEL